MNNKVYYTDDNTAFKLFDLLKAKARHVIKIDEWNYRLFDGNSAVTFTTLSDSIKIKMVKG